MQELFTSKNSLKCMDKEKTRAWIALITVTAIALDS